MYKLSNKERILFFIITGLISGVVSGMGQFFLPENELYQNYYPAVVLGIFLYIAGRYGAHIKTGIPAFDLIILIIFSILGWRLAVNVGYDLGGPVPFVNAGALGAFVVASGWLIAWKIRTGIIPLILLVTIAGATGGLIFHFADSFISMTEEMWILFLFTEWQSILFFGMAISHLLTQKQ